MSTAQHLYQSICLAHKLVLAGRALARPHLLHTLSTAPDRAVSKHSKRSPPRKPAFLSQRQTLTLACQHLQTQARGCGLLTRAQTDPQKRGVAPRLDQAELRERPEKKHHESREGRVRVVVSRQSKAQGTSIGLGQHHWGVRVDREAAKR
jgi:hypothetical protein